MHSFFFIFVRFNFFAHKIEIFSERASFLYQSLSLDAAFILPTNGAATNRDR